MVAVLYSIFNNNKKSMLNKVVLLNLILARNDTELYLGLSNLLYFMALVSQNDLSMYDVYYMVVGRSR